MPEVYSNKLNPKQTNKQTPKSNQNKRNQQKKPEPPQTKNKQPPLYIMKRGLLPPPEQSLNNFLSLSQTLVYIQSHTCSVLREERLLHMTMNKACTPQNTHSKVWCGASKA